MADIGELEPEFGQYLTDLLYDADVAPKELARRLTANGRPVSDSYIRKLMAGTRVLDFDNKLVDDIADALNLGEDDERRERLRGARAYTRLRESLKETGWSPRRVKAMLSSWRQIYNSIPAIVPAWLFGDRARSTPDSVSQPGARDERSMSDRTHVTPEAITSVDREPERTGENSRLSFPSPTGSGFLPPTPESWEASPYIGSCVDFVDKMAPPRSWCSVPAGCVVATASDVLYRSSVNRPWTKVANFGTPCHDPVELPRGPLQVGCPYGASFSVVDASRQPISPASPERILVQLSGPIERVDISWARTSLDFGNVSFLRSESDTLVFMGSTWRTYRLSGPDLGSILPSGQPVPSPDRNGARIVAEYAKSCSVLRAADDKSLLMFYEADNLYDRNYAIKLAMSHDEGKTWVQRGQVISGISYPGGVDTPGSNSGMRVHPTLPCVVRSKDGMSYLAYFSVRTLSARTPGIHVAIAPAKSDGLAGSWTKYRVGDFTQSGLGGQSDSVIDTRHISDSHETLSVSKPHISYNVALRRYLAIVSTIDGFYYTTSIDGLSWETGRTLLSEADDHRTCRNPVFLSPDQPSHDRTSGYGWLYFTGHGDRNEQYSTVYRMRMEVMR